MLPEYGIGDGDRYPMPPGFNGHPPLGVNATDKIVFCHPGGFLLFQWAPTLGGECYGIVYLITPPLCQGVDALLNISPRF